MTKVARVVGVDPGIVHTGVVSLEFKPGPVLYVDHDLVTGLDADLVAHWIGSLKNTSVYVEQYKPRQRLNTDVRMVQAEADLRRSILGARFLPNMGIRRVVPQQLMEALGLWTWTTTSHHQDLRSAARIALLGMMKDDHQNRVIADMVRAYVDGTPWEVRIR